MTIAVTGVPESLTREQVIEWLALVGLRADDLRSAQIERGAITAEVYARDEDGQRYAVGLGDDARLAVHIVSIPIND